MIMSALDDANEEGKKSKKQDEDLAKLVKDQGKKK